MVTKRKARIWSQPNYYREDRSTMPYCYIRTELRLTQQDWFDLELIAEEQGTDPRRLLADVAKRWLAQEIVKTFEEAA